MNYTGNPSWMRNGRFGRFNFLGGRGSAERTTRGCFSVLDLPELVAEGPKQERDPQRSIQKYCSPCLGELLLAGALPPAARRVTREFGGKCFRKEDSASRVDK